MVSDIDIKRFKEQIWQFYRQYGRSFAWRHNDNPYHVVVSEIMLQQTQTHRVEGKFELFVTEFRSFESLAAASLRDVLALWQGLGYNRRARYLQEVARIVTNNYDGQLPRDPAILETFPGIGAATAASICAFAFNSPTIFIETNIRAVFIHSFFPGREKVSDKELVPLVEKTIDQDSPRDWYYALMDYGVMLKKTHKNPSRRSKHHTKQSRFEGSDRQIRGAILRYLTNNGPTQHEALFCACAIDERERFDTIVEQLCHEGFLSKHAGQLSIA